MNKCYKTLKHKKRVLRYLLFGITHLHRREEGTWKYKYKYNWLERGKEINIDTYYLEQKTFFPDVYCHSALVGLLFFLAFLSHETSSQGSIRSIRVE